MIPAAEWERCRPWIEAAIAEGLQTETIADVEKHLADGAYTFWPGNRSAAITEIITFNRRRLLDVKYCGGDLDELLTNTEPSMCLFAQHMGCDGITGGGRKGWERVVKAKGYRFAFVTCIKDIEQ